MNRLLLMETFAAVARHQSYTRAAKDLGLTRAMVSKRITDLEGALGVRLFNRNAHRVSTTAAGADYLKDCVTLLDEVAQIEGRLLEKHAAPRGDLKIITSKTLGDMLLAPIVAEFCKKYPDISLRLLLGDMLPNGTDLIAEGFDLAVRTIPVSDSALIARPIARLRRVLVAAPDYLKSSGALTCPGDLTARNCLNPNDSRDATWRFNTGDGRISLNVTGMPRTNSTAAVRQAVLKGLGIALLSEFAVASDLRQGHLVRVLPELYAEERMLYVIYQRDRYRPLRVKLFNDFLTQRIATFSWADPIRPFRGKKR